MSTIIHSQSIDTTHTRRSDQVVSKLVDRMMTRLQSAPEETIDAYLYNTKDQAGHRERLAKIIGQNYPDVRSIVGSLGECYLELEEFVQIEQNDAEWGDIDVVMAWAGHAVKLQEFFEEIIPEVETEVPVVTPIVVPPTTLDLKILEKDLTALQKSGKIEKIWERLDRLSSCDLHAVNTADAFFLRYICSPIHEWECYNRKCIFKIYLKDLVDLCQELEFEGFDLIDLQRKISEAKSEQLHPMAMGFGSMRLSDCKYVRKGDHKSTLELTKVKIRPEYTRLQADLVLPEYLMDYFIKKYANGQEYLLLERRVTRPPGKVGYSWDQIEHVQENGI